MQFYNINNLLIERNIEKFWIIEISSYNILSYIFNIVFILDIIKLFCFTSILFSLKSNSSNFSNLTFSNTDISDILFLSKINLFNSLKLTFRIYQY